MDNYGAVPRKLKLSTGGKMAALVAVMAVAALLAAVLAWLDAESRHKAEVLNERLQHRNSLVCMELPADGVVDSAAAARAAGLHVMPGLRTTVVAADGRVVYESHPHSAEPENHLERKEVAQAMAEGRGYDIGRESKTAEGRFFYAATYCGGQGVVVRSAVRYDFQMEAALAHYQPYLWVAVLALAAAAVAALWYSRRVARNVENLRAFARMAGGGDTLETEDLARFPSDELGEVSELIVKMYMRLERTRKEKELIKRQLTQNAAHELKTPLASLMGYLETMKGSRDMDEDTRTRFTERSYAQARRLATIVDDLSTLSYLDGGFPSRAEDMDAAAVVSEAVADTAEEISAAGMSVKVDLPGEMPMVGDRTAVYGIFRNLLDNAAAYAGRGAVVEIRGEEAADEWRLSLEDNGVGVPPEHLPRLFERFYRVDKGRSRSLGGTGLGLAIVKNAVAMHGGQIALAARDSGGLSFKFALKKNP